MFHLLTVFPNNATEQKRYYITNVLKKPQCVSICQFVQRVEQLNSYISQVPCWYYSPSVKANTILMNVPFAEADLASHVLRMCPYAWRVPVKMFRCHVSLCDVPCSPLIMDQAANWQIRCDPLQGQGQAYAGLVIIRALHKNGMRVFSGVACQNNWDIVHGHSRHSHGTALGNADDGQG